MTAAFHTRESLLVTGSIALGAVRELIRQREGELRRQFPSFLVDSAKALFPEAEDGQAKIGKRFGQWTVENQSAYAEKSVRSSGRQSTGADSVIVRPLGPGGIFNALWDTCELYGAGAVVDIKKIPIRQEPVQILE